MSRKELAPGEADHVGTLMGKATVPGAPLIRGVRMSGYVKGKGRGAARKAQMGRAHPYETSRNLVIRGTHSSENRG